ncbi:hypothetical protein D3C81_1249720 [compost metagenome]
MVADPTGEYVAQHGGTLHEIEALENHADVAANHPQRFAGGLRDRLAVDPNIAFGDIVQPVHGPQQRRFASAGQTNDGHEFTGLNLQVDLVQPFGAIRVRFGYIAQFYHVRTPFEKNILEKRTASRERRALRLACRGLFVKFRSKPIPF